ncbi:elongation factor G [Bombiscardovia nodaiensis]|uniref:Elongation factor G n=1 Tax=Bombiscardovia nodaiensis TaxID=2932181 RepID=A0ABM8B6W9_9BIFI|nr:elongation factor G [Bombiscardovia nodaiensis]
MKRLVVGILAHVDAGKTTLSEAMLYRAGRIRKLGRVDHGDTFLDTDPMEKARGITIFSKQALLEYDDVSLTLLDTPGHADFSAQMEEAISAMDYAILVVSATDGLQGHTLTLWRLLEHYQVPTFMFVNKMDAPGVDQMALLRLLQERLSPGCMACPLADDTGAREAVALLSEEAMEEYLSTGALSASCLQELVARRLLFPTYFGSALRLEGVDDLLQGLRELSRQPQYGDDFGARVFKISHDPEGNRLTWLKVTGASLLVKSRLEHVSGEEGEKVDQLRQYSGAKFETVIRAPAGMICAATGLNSSFPGQGLGFEKDLGQPMLEPVLTYTVLPGEADLHRVLQALRLLEDEDPLLRVRWVPQLEEIHLQLMGTVQLEVIQESLQERFGLDIAFGPGSILYKETITGPVEGVGHFEPLRHYAEVHLLLEPTGPGSGLSFASQLSQDELAGNWQRLVLSHLKQKEHLGVLTGSPITDMRLTLIAGRAHEKHTEGGDFRQATYRAVRQGLMSAHSALLEPWYNFHLELPQEQLGHAMADLQRMSGSFDPPSTEGEFAILEGQAPVSQMRDYALEVKAYTHGQGTLTCTSAGYQPCHNAEEVIAAAHYDPESDLENTPDSVFCAHGAGYPVKWNRVPAFMHLPGGPYLRD